MKEPYSWRLACLSVIWACTAVLVGSLWIAIVDAQQPATAAECNAKHPGDDVAYVACLVGGLRMAETVALPALQGRIDAVLARIERYAETGERITDWTASIVQASLADFHGDVQLYIETSPEDADVVCWPDMVSGGATVSGAVRSFLFHGTPSRGDTVHITCAGVGLFGGVQSAGSFSR